MIVESVYVLTIVSLVNLIALLIVSFISLKTPPKFEMLMIVLALVSAQLCYIFYTINNVYSTPTMIHKETVIYTRLGYFFAIAGISLITFAVIFIDFKPNYLNLAEIIVYTWIGMSSTLYNALSMDFVLKNGFIETQYNPIGILFVILFFSFTIGIWLKRILRIYNVTRINASKKSFLISFFVFIIIGTTLIVSYIALNLVFKSSGNFAFIAGGVIAIFGALFLAKNNAFLFITDTVLDSVIVIEKNSGLRLFSKQFKQISNKSENSDFLASVISAINISISTTLKSEKSLTEMQFSDKTVLLSTGSYVRSIMIISGSNFTSKSVSKYIVSCFEKKFSSNLQTKIKKGPYSIGSQNDYKGFELDINYIRKFIPV